MSDNAEYLRSGGCAIDQGTKLLMKNEAKRFLFRVILEFESSDGASLGGGVPANAGTPSFVRGTSMCESWSGCGAIRRKRWHVLTPLMATDSCGCAAVTASCHSRSAVVIDRTVYRRTNS